MYFIDKFFVFFPLFLSTRCYLRTPVENLLTLALVVRKVNGERNGEGDVSGIKALAVRCW